MTITTADGLTSFDLYLLERAFWDDCKIQIDIHSIHSSSAVDVAVHSEGFGQWHLFAGFGLQWGLVQADNEQEAFDIYMHDHVPCDERGESSTDDDRGYTDSCGGYYSESTVSYIINVPLSGMRWEVRITPSEESEQN